MVAQSNVDDTAEIPIIRVLPDASASAARSLQRAAKDLVHAGQAFLELLDEFLDDDELVDDTVAKVAQWIDRTVLRAEPWVGSGDAGDRGAASTDSGPSGAAESGGPGRPKGRGRVQRITIE